MCCSIVLHALSELDLKSIFNPYFIARKSYSREQYIYIYIYITIANNNNIIYKKNNDNKMKNNQIIANIHNQSYKYCCFHGMKDKLKTKKEKRKKVDG